VGDAKYKADKTEQGLNADLYQMLAYLVAADLPAGMLIYARGEGAPTQHRVRHVGKTVIVESLNLEATPEQVLGQFTRLAQVIRQVVGLSASIPIWK
jgi:5-methylcytosine-specific restriction endonuclease McrBC regulatory subunit McrC